MQNLNKLIEQCQSNDSSLDEILLQPFKYLLQVPGKQIRAKLANGFNYWLNIPADKLQSVGEIVQMLHNASLLIDDIQDNSILRRGIPVAHSIFGVASTINAANYVFFLALKKVQALGHPEATAVYTEQLLELHRGQGMEIYWRDNFTCPSEDDYKIMTMRKTGGLFMLAVRLMQIFSDNKSDFTKLAGILGLYFQIRDDYCNLCSQEYSENKSFCEDLTEGKFSFPIIHAIHSHPEDKQILNILRQRTKDLEVKKYCISLMDKFGSFEHTRDVLDALDGEARLEVQSLGGNPHLEAILDEMLSWKNTVNTPNSHEMLLPYNWEPPPVWPTILQHDGHPISEIDPLKPLQITKERRNGYYLLECFADRITAVDELVKKYLKSDCYLKKQLIESAYA